MLFDVVRTFQGEPYEEPDILDGLLLCDGLFIANQFKRAARLVPCAILYTLHILRDPPLTHLASGPAVTHPPARTVAQLPGMSKL